uniref:Retrotransposon gag domain-containing protein n=1 Tax=Chenopodium quinoa TaxID=63459 RepID=A0A803MSE5_CHEQI
MHPRISPKKIDARRRRKAIEDAILALSNLTVAPPLNQGQLDFDRFDHHRPPIYEGTADPMVLESWLREMEKFFTATNCPPQERVTIGSYYLKMEADSWWSTVREECMAVPCFGWKKFPTKLKEIFYPDELRWQKQEDKFTKLSRFSTIILPSKSKRVKQYIKKMDPKVRTIVLSSGASSFQGAYEIALRIHASIREKEAARSVNAKKPVGTFTQSPTKKPKIDSST